MAVPSAQWFGRRLEVGSDSTDAGRETPLSDLSAGLWGKMPLFIRIIRDWKGEEAGAGSNGEKKTLSENIFKI